MQLYNYEDIIISFLEEVNGTKQAKEICDLNYDFHKAAIAQCEGDALNCNNSHSKTHLLKEVVKKLTTYCVQ